MPLYNPPQPLDSDLTAIAALTTTSAGLALLDDADASAQRTTLGLGTAAVKATGVSGDAVPVLNGAATTWAAGMALGGNLSVTGRILGTQATPGDEAMSVTGVSGASFQIDSGGANFSFMYANTIRFGTTDLTTRVEITSTGADIIGLLRCDTFRIDAAPTAETPPATHTAAVNLNGVAYKLLCVAA